MLLCERRVKLPEKAPQIVLVKETQLAADLQAKKTGWETAFLVCLRAAEVAPLLKEFMQDGQGCEPVQRCLGVQVKGLIGLLWSRIHGCCVCVLLCDGCSRCE